MYWIIATAEVYVGIAAITSVWKNSAEFVCIPGILIIPVQVSCKYKVKIV